MTRSVPFAVAAAVSISCAATAQSVGGCPPSDSAGRVLMVGIAHLAVYDSAFRVHGIAQAERSSAGIVPLVGVADSSVCARLVSSERGAADILTFVTDTNYIVSYYRLGKHYVILERVRPMFIRPSGVVGGGTISQYVMFDSTLAVVYAAYTKRY